MIDELLLDCEERMEKALASVTKDFTQIRTGKATTALLDNIKVECYDQLMPLNQVATVGAPEMRLLTIQPWDKTNLQAIEKAIQKSDLGLNPANDGHIIRLAIPQLTEDRRKELVKHVKRYGEDGKIAIRNIRRDIIEKLKKMEKDKEIREDDLYRAQEDVQKLTDDFTNKIDAVVKIKEEEIMTV
ncbi:ribosome recycling factor [candidate division KSB1 bacterium]